tara:strand:- start:2001 stop:2969 length:969 start_codon:yes stop_codon:yes gene_type:complete
MSGRARENMANKLPAKKYKHSQPTQIRMSFECQGNATRFIDIAKSLSAINRRGGYRQGVYYYVNSVEVYNNSTGVLDLHTLPDTWVTKMAHQRGRKLWSKMNRMVSPPLMNGVAPAYHDYKVYMSEEHVNRGSLSPSLHGINATAVTITSDDWVYSDFVSADDDGDNTQNADQFTTHMLGNHIGTTDNWNSIGLIKSYAESRATVSVETPNDDNIQVTDPLVNIFDFSSEEQINEIALNLLTDNDNPPYDIDLYNGESGNHMQHVARIGTEVGIGRVGRAAGFCAPFGLICIDADGLSANDNFRVVINLASGTYDGVYAERV